MNGYVTREKSVTCDHTLRQLNYFGGLNHEQRQEVAQHCRGRRYEAGDLVCSGSENARQVFFIVAGKARVMHHATSGKETEFRLLGEGESFGEVSLFSGRGCDIDVVANTDLTVLVMCAESFGTILRRYPSVATQVFLNLSNMIALLSDRIVEFSTLARKRSYPRRNYAHRPARGS